MLIQNKKRLKFNPFLLISALLFIICTTSVAAYPVSVTDSKGNHLKIFKTPHKVISLVPSATQIIFEIGAKEHIHAITYHDITLAGAFDKQIIGGFFLPSIDKIKTAKPDMIILSTLHQDIIEKFQNTECKIFIFDTTTIESAYKNIEVLGKIFNREQAAQKIIKKNKAELNHIKQKLAKINHLKHKRVIRLMGKNTIMTPGTDSFQTRIIRAAGGIAPDFGKKGSIVSVTKQEWIKFNPQVIYGCGPDKEAAKKFFSKPGWKDVDAVKKGQIYYFPCDLTCRASTHTGYFVSWLSSMIYTDEFAKAKNTILPITITRSKPFEIDLDYIKSASINYSHIYDFENKTLVVDFQKDQTIISTLEGQRDHILTVGNHYSPPPTWAPGHHLGIEHIRSSILKAMGKNQQTASFLMTGADMDNLSVKTKVFKEMKVVALVTAGVMSNAVRMSKDTGDFYEPGTINVIIMTNMRLSTRAMTRAIIAGTEAKTAALEDMDIRSSYTPLINAATGTGTDNIMVVQGEGQLVENAGGHSKMGELIAKAVYDGVSEAILKQNKITADRHLFQRLKERKISIFQLVSNVNCDCINNTSGTPNRLAQVVEHLLLEPQYASFLESAMAISDEYEKGLVKDLFFFQKWCRTIAGDIAGKNIEEIKIHVMDDHIPVTLKTAFDAIFTGALAKLNTDGSNPDKSNQGKSTHENN
ncbi:adenosylcobinamide amidohydrolase [Desulfobacula phenolica]|uniref:ABC-type Fe3+-hydroxamate transport system, substrate-binding protein n=1 Tax=Desulfobacula phenolica TaxID=90732 RepID=A0A1H2HJS8_9BACT|nr:adenosylcobinamide amidohydrolase [Desulfobacula phenolica]SDU32093.1 ABC-type Fe3+-hydroxamate transport system, substrate-binding protein [Desulfobacula phenolica]